MGQYHSYLWAAFFPESQGRRQSGAQLFLLVHANGLDVGIAIDAAEPQVRARFRRAIAGREAGRLAEWVRRREPQLTLRRFTNDGRTDALMQSGVDTETMGVLAQEESGWTLVVRFSPEACSTSDLTEQVDRAVRALLPLYLAALVDDLGPVLDALGVPGGSVQDEAEEDEDTDDEPPPGYTLDQLQAATHLEKAWLQELVNAATLDLKRPGSIGQIVLYGPPGSGKTFLAEHLALHLVDGDTSRIEMVQLHPAYSYEHFIEGFRPRSDNGNLLFDLQPGILRRLIDRIVQTDRPHVLVVDEMNRGDLPQVLGELMYLLSRRGKGATVQLARSGDALALPDKLTIIGTMNTADRSIAHVDFALRRRFRFFRLAPSPKVLEAVLGKADPEWARAMASLLIETNHRLAKRGPGFEIGHSYLLGVHGWPALQEVWDREIVPAIEDWLDFEPSALRDFQWEATRKRVQGVLDGVVPELEDDE